MRRDWVGFGVVGLVVVSLLITSCSWLGSRFTKLPQDSGRVKTPSVRRVEFLKAPASAGTSLPDVSFMIGTAPVPPRLTGHPMEGGIYAPDDVTLIPERPPLEPEESESATAWAMLPEQPPIQLSSRSLLKSRAQDAPILQQPEGTVPTAPVQLSEETATQDTSEDVSDPAVEETPKLPQEDLQVAAAPLPLPEESEAQADSKKVSDPVGQEAPNLQQVDGSIVTGLVKLPEETTTQQSFGGVSDSAVVEAPKLPQADLQVATASLPLTEESEAQSDSEKESDPVGQDSPDLRQVDSSIVTGLVKLSEETATQESSEEVSDSAMEEPPDSQETDSSLAIAPVRLPEQPDVKASSGDASVAADQDTADLQQEESPLPAALVILPKIPKAQITTMDLPEPLVQDPLIQQKPDAPVPSARAKLPKVAKTQISSSDLSQPLAQDSPISRESLEMAVHQTSSKYGAAVPSQTTPIPEGQKARIGLNPDMTGPVRLMGMDLQDVGPTVATVVIESDKPIVNYKSFALPDPPRLVIDFPEAIPSLPTQVKALNAGPIKTIRSFQYGVQEEKVVRVVMELSSQLPYLPQLPYRIQAAPGPMQIVVGMPVASQSSVIPVAAAPAPAQAPATLAVEPSYSAPVRPSGPPGLDVRISVDLRQMDILAVMKFLAKEGSLNIVTGKNVGGRVSLSLQDVSIRDILDIIALSYELAHVVQNGIIHVMTEADYTRLFGSSFADQRKVEALQLSHADANAVSAVLNNMKSAVGRVIADAQTRTIVLMDVPEKLGPMVATARSMDQATMMQTHVFELHYGKAEEIQAEVQKVLTPNLGSVNLDKRTNTLVVSDIAPRMSDVRRVIGAFDRKTREVSIESRIVQVRLDDKFQMGVNWEVLFQQLADLRLQGTFPITPSLATSGKITVGTLADDDFTAVLELLQTVGKTNVLSSPQIAVVENEEAKILVGTREAFVTSVVTQTQQAATTAEEVTFVDVGVSLTATPNINKDGFVIMKIKPEVSSVTRTLTTASGNKIPIVQTSTAETTVMVKDGVTIIIAGLIEDQSINTTKKVPILGDIPFLGAAFRSKEDEVIKSELVIFLTPRIISGKESMASRIPSAP